MYYILVLAIKILASKGKHGTPMLHPSHHTCDKEEAQTLLGGRGVGARAVDQLGTHQLRCVATNKIQINLILSSLPNNFS